jgi:hypothetical protein
MAVRKDTMLGFHISIYKLQNGAQPVSSALASKGVRLAVWQSGIGGLHWLDGLVKKGVAISLGGDGYPTAYTARIKHLRPAIFKGPLEANAVWGCDPGDILTDGWCGTTTIDQKALGACSPDEWVLVEAWDES